MESEYVEADDSAIKLAFKALKKFDGQAADVALPAIIVLVSEIISQITSDRKEIAQIMLAITDSVFMNCTQAGKQASGLN